MATNPILSAFPLANLMVRKITTKARMKSACPQNVAFRFIKFLIDELPEKHITPCLGAQTHGLKFRSEATQPMCLRPSEPASDYSRLLGEHSFTTAKPKSMLATIYPYSFLDKLPVLY